MKQLTSVNFNLKPRLHSYLQTWIQTLRTIPSLLSHTSKVPEIENTQPWSATLKIKGQEDLPSTKFMCGWCVMKVFAFLDIFFYTITDLLTELNL